MERIERPVFSNRWLPFLFVLPQVGLAITFFIWPAAVSLYQSMMRTDPFGLKTTFIGVANFRTIFSDPRYFKAVQLSFLFALIVTLGTISLGLLLATAANKPVPGSRFFRTLLMSPYALAPAIAAVLWLFLFQPSIGIVSRWLKSIGISWNYALNSLQAMVLIMAVAIWQRLPYNFIFLFAALQNIPASVIEAARLDGAGERRIFWSIIFPLLSPTTFFLTVVNLSYALFDSFGIIDALTKGGPAGATTLLCYKVYLDGFVHLRLSSSAAQSVILLIIGIVLSLVQFRFVQKRVHYE